MPKTRTNWRCAVHHQATGLGAWAAGCARSQPRSLSDGRAIPADVAILIIANVSVEPANDGLFPNLLAQTWRMK